MQLSTSIVRAAIAAIIIGGFVFWFHEHYVLSISYGPSGVPVGEVFKGQEIIAGYQDYINYRYILGALFAIATFSAVYYWSRDDMEMEGGIVAICFLIPSALNYIFILTIYIAPLLILGLLIRTFFLYMHNKTILYRSYLLCSIFNCISLIVMYMNAVEAFRDA